MAFLTLLLQKEVPEAACDNLVETLQQQGWLVEVKSMLLHAEEEAPRAERLARREQLKKQAEEKAQEEERLRKMHEDFNPQ